MKLFYSNINIIGGGLIGAATAYALSKLDYKITILEKKPRFNSIRYPDNRTVAVSEGTKNFFDKIGLWNNLKKYSQPIKKIKIIDREPNKNLEFDNIRRSSNLGYIIKNKNLLKVIYNQLENKKNITLFNNVDVKDLKIKEDLIITNLNKQSIISELNIAADGKESQIRKLYKTPTYKKNYNKKALVLTFTHTLDHKNTAFEYFYENGPFAILPMLKTNNKHTSSIIWTHNNKYISNLYNMDNKKLISVLNLQTKLCIGEINKIFTKQTFPLSAQLNTRFYEKRTIYIGDSAHSFHPIAGQGWNLGIKDLENLYVLAKKNKSLGIDLGDSFFCKKFHNENFYNAYRLYQLTDKLDSIFKIQNPTFAFGRSMGLNILKKNKTITNLISDFAMGIN